MGPFDDIGPYAETVIATRTTDGQGTDNVGVRSLVIPIIVLIPTTCALALVIGTHPIVGVLIGLGIVLFVIGTILERHIGRDLDWFFNLRFIPHRQRKSAKVSDACMAMIRRRLSGETPTYEMWQKTPRLSGIERAAILRRLPDVTK